MILIITMLIYATFKGYNQLSEVAIATDDALKAFVSFCYYFDKKYVILSL